MYIKAAVHKAAIAGAVLLVICACTLMMIFSDGCKNGVTEGLDFCLRVLVPSLFPFMAAVGLMVKTGLCHKIGHKLSKPTRVIFGLDGAFAPIIILSLIGGYPVGARAIAQLYKQGAVSAKQAERAAMFAVCAGPGFLISFVGAGIYQNETVGLIILCSQVLSVIILGIILNIFNKHKDFEPIRKASVSSVPFSTAIVESARDAAGGMAGICSLVLLFSAVIGICEELIPNQMANDFISSALEICSAVGTLSINYPIEVTAFAIGFGGICVHFQIFAALGDLKINKFLFFLYRIIQGIITAVLTHIGIKLFLKETAVFSSGSVGSAGIFGGSALGGAALMTVAICFLFSLRKQ